MLTLLNTSRWRTLLAITLPLILIAIITIFIGPAFAELGATKTASGDTIPPLHPGALFCIFIFVLAYVLVLLEEKTKLSKSKPVMVAAAIIWITIGIIAPKYGYTHDDIHGAVFHGLEEYAALLLFLLAAMTYITTMEDRNVFEVLRVKLIQGRMNMRQLFWMTGIITFFLSPIADNLTTALVMGAVILAVGRDDPKFVALGCVNIVAAANAGGAFSPFGDITTLMVWQAGKVEFFAFFALFIPAAVNFLIPATIMSFFVPKDLPAPVREELKLKRGAKRVILLGLCTIATAVSCEQFLGLPPFLGMMAGLSALSILAYYLCITGEGRPDNEFRVLKLVKGAEWDTLLFFYGVIFCVGGLSFLGYMELASTAMYDGFGASITNISLGVISAVIDNIPVMFAVLTMNPQMDHFQWLLITLTTGVGGTILSVGSAAGVALMGAAHGKYTFMNHLKWTPVLLVGYVAAIITHFVVNGHLMSEAGAGVADAAEAVKSLAH